MNIQSFLSSIPFLRNFTSSSPDQAGANANGNLSTNQSLESIRQQAIQDTVEISPSASRALESVDTSSELSSDEIQSILSDARSSLESNDNIDLGSDTGQLQNL